MKKLILTDCDEVLLNWRDPFDDWMKSLGYPHLYPDKFSANEQYGLRRDQGLECVRNFNKTDRQRNLPPFRDAMYYVRKLHERHGYVFRVITSLGLHPHQQAMRTANLKDLFGTAIESVVYLDTCQDKDEALAPYKDSGKFWIEDKVQNAVLGETLGLNSLLMEHPYNIHDTSHGVPIVSDWHDIYDTIT